MLLEFIEKVSRAELGCDVNAFVYQELHLWPLFRYEIQLKFRNSERYLKQSYEMADQSFGGKIKALVRASSNQKIITQTVRKIKESEVLIVDAHSKLSEFGGVVYNPFLDPMLELCLKHSKTVSKVGLAWRDDRANDSSSFETIHLNRDLFFSDYLKDNVERKGMQKVLEPIVREMERVSGIEINHRHFFHQLDRVLFSRYIYDKVLKEVNPKVVFFECFYKPEMFGLILSCKNLGIKTVDIQHGKQGTHHLMYSHWLNVPEGGYSVLPDYFWNWGEESVRNIEQHSHKNMGAHQAIVGGNLWLAKWIHEAPKALNEGWEAFLEKTKKHKKVVLISLQTSSFEQDSAIPKFVQEVIRNFDKESILWLIRKHPSEKELDADISVLAEMENVESNMATTMPLYMILKLATHHITKFSSVAFEANVFGVATILIHKSGKQLYEGQIKDKHFYYADNSNDLISLLSNESLDSAPMNYIETSCELSDKAFQRVWDNTVSEIEATNLN